MPYQGMHASNSMLVLEPEPFGHTHTLRDPKERKPEICLREEELGRLGTNAAVEACL